jgi:hypothetical protein
MNNARLLSAEQFLLATLVGKLAVMAALATMLARYRRFRHILIFERRDWPDRLAFALGLTIPLALGVVSRLLLNYDAADLMLEARSSPASSPDRTRVPSSAAPSPCPHCLRRSGERFRSPWAAASPAAACAKCAPRSTSGTSRPSSSSACRATRGAC